MKNFLNENILNNSSQYDNKLNLDKLKERISKSKYISMGFLIMGIGVLASYNAILTALFWVDENIKH